MRNFAYDLRQTRVVFASGSFDILRDEIARQGWNSAFLITTPGRSALVERAKSLLGEKYSASYDRSVEHVPTAILAEALAELRSANPDVCIAIGGGSAIGLAKAIALETSLPVVAIPTTYSGSEMTSIWGITGAEGKRTGRDPGVAPRVVIYDPDLTLELPAQISAASGMNAVAHSVEGLYAQNANPVSDALAEESIRLLSMNLQRVVKDPHDKPARSDALEGAHLAGRVLDMTSMGLHHRLCHVLGGRFRLPHAMTHAILLPYVAAFNLSVVPNARERIAQALDVTEAVRGLSELRTRLGITQTLAQLGLREEDLDAVADETVATAYPNPRPASKADIVAILSAALSGAAV
jgi:maleylacetate reductase